MNICLNCGRDLSALKRGEIEPSGYMLCMGCGHVMCYTEQLTLREMTGKERIDAGTHQALMRERLKIVPDHSVKHHGTSLAMVCLLSLVVGMIIVERINVGRAHELCHNAKGISRDGAMGSRSRAVQFCDLARRR